MAALGGEGVASASRHVEDTVTCIIACNSGLDECRIESTYRVQPEKSQETTSFPNSTTLGEVHDQISPLPLQQRERERMINNFKTSYSGIRSCGRPRASRHQLCAHCESHRLTSANSTKGGAYPGSPAWQSCNWGLKIWRNQGLRLGSKLVYRLYSICTRFNRYGAL